MRLISAEIHGFRRFADPEKIYIDRRLVCLVGANEVGKSSLLLALRLAATPDHPIESGDRSRGRGVQDDHRVARLDLRLDQDDKSAIKDLGLRGEASKAHRLVLSKHAGGRITAELDAKLSRDLGPRQSAATGLQRAASGKGWISDEDAAGTAAEPERLAGLQAELASDQESLADNHLAELRDLAARLNQAEVELDLAETLLGVAAHEESAHPHDEAIERLLERVPQFVDFDEGQRQLEAEYDLAAVAEAPPPALRNLAALAGLDLRALQGAIARNETGSAQTLRDNANEVLREEFSAWSQKPRIEVAFDHTDELLRVHVKSGTGELMKIDERSDGLRQFVALVALIGGTRRTIKPVLLIDEAERHLHMDAQADLMQILSRQTAAVQVIYATHSPASRNTCSSSIPRW